MISDECMTFFETKGYKPPAHGLPVVKMDRRAGEPERWQITLFSVERKTHVFETADSAVEVVSKMVMRLSRTTPDSVSRETGKMEALDVAFSGLIFSLAGNSEVRRG